MTDLNALAERPEGHCGDDKAWLEFTRQYAGQPRSYADMTDFALANAVFMADRNDLSLIHYQTAAKERIRWLSIRLADALRKAGEMEAALSDVRESCLYAEDDGTVGVTLEPSLGEALFDRICDLTRDPAIRAALNPPAKGDGR